MLACDQCDYRATVKSKLLIHQQTHGSEKPFVCEICQKGFKQQAQLKNHSLVHVAGVDVKEKESMSGRHWFVQVACGICKRTFANQKSLQCHIEAVHEKVSDLDLLSLCSFSSSYQRIIYTHYIRIYTYYIRIYTYYIRIYTYYIRIYTYYIRIYTYYVRIYTYYVD